MIPELFYFVIVVGLCGGVHQYQYADIPTTIYATGGQIYGMGADPAGVQVPFGMVRLGPDTVSKYNAYVDKEHAGGELSQTANELGYYSSDKYIRLFSHIHMVGPGAPDYGNIGVMPFSADRIFSHPDYDLHLQDYNYKSSFTLKSTKPGYFSTSLDDTEINVELTSTDYVGVHRYQFSNTQRKRPYILFYASHAIKEGGCHGSSVHIDPVKQEVCGWVDNWGDLTERQNGIKIYFCARTDQRWTSFGTWGGGRVYPQNTSISGLDVGAYLGNFENEESFVELYVGVSFISEDYARQNLDQDIAYKTFDDVRTDCVSRWESELGRVKIGSSPPVTERLKTFYSALYRTMNAPTLFSETGGAYLGFDRKVHHVKDPQKYYTDMSIWDVHRTQFPLLALIERDVMSDIVSSLVLMYQQGGDLPMWPIAAGYTGCMIGSHAVVSITDAFLKGVKVRNVTGAYHAMRHVSTESQTHAGRDVYDWLHFGFIPLNNNTHGACLTLAYSYDDGTLSTFAERIGEKDDAKMFRQRGQGYRHVWCDESKFFCPKDVGGKFDCPTDFTDIFDPRYVEGDAWHYRFFVLHDMDGLIELFGGAERFVEELEVFVEKEFEDPYTAIPNKYFWVGNEHNLASPWLFNFANRPDLTAKYIPKILDMFFAATPDGCPGNDDFGTTSAWAVWGFLGFYPIAGTTLYSIGAPQFENYVLNIGEYGKECELRFKVKEFLPKVNVYVKEVWVDGKEHGLYFFDHEKDFVCEGNKKVIQIEFVMDVKPPVYE